MKFCNGCGQLKPKSEFNKDKYKKDGHDYLCRLCRRKKWQEYYGLANRDNFRRRGKTFRLRAGLAIRSFIQSYLQGHPCVDCGEADIMVLEFDHVRGKKHFTISDFSRVTYSLTKVKTEIEKCDVRCANCHRRKHVSSLKDS